MPRLVMNSLFLKESLFSDRPTENAAMLSSFVVDASTVILSIKSDWRLLAGDVNSCLGDTFSRNSKKKKKYT